MEIFKYLFHFIFGDADAGIFYSKFDGDLLVVGDTPPSGPDPQTAMELDERRVTYELLCRAHWAARQPTPESAGHTAAEGEQT